LTRVANGHLQLSVQDPGLLDGFLLRLKLQVGHGFRRQGKRITSLDEGIAPDFVRGSLRLEAGYDHWTGVYLLAEDEAGDQFLTGFASELT
jgi:hypothetical protein